MIGESFYYISNKKYIGRSTAMLSALSESPWSGVQSRRISIIMPDGHSAVQESYASSLSNDYPLANAEDMITFANYSDIDSWEYLNNNTKEFLLFESAHEFLKVYAKYTASLLKTTTSKDVKQVVKEFIVLATTRDVTYSTMGVYNEGDINAAVEEVFAENVFYDIPNATSKHWGYDILFFINDKYNENETYAEINVTTTAFLREKFTVHSDKMIHEVISMLQSKIGYVSVINNIIDWFNNNGNTEWNRAEFVKDVFQNTNRMQALYRLRDFWNDVGTNEELMALIDGHDEWEYEEVYKEFARTIPIVIQIAEGGFNFANNEALRSAWSEVEFFYKRKSRIPYLLFKILPLVPE
jgi:hypothetical protein